MQIVIIYTYYNYQPLLFLTIILLADDKIRILSRIIFKDFQSFSVVKFFFQEKIRTSEKSEIIELIL